MCFVNASYIDDSLLISDDLNHSQQNVSETLKLFQSLGFTIHFEKSVLNPGKLIRFLGFEINSETMMVSLPRKKEESLVKFCTFLHSRNACSIKELASLIGTLVSVMPAVKYGQLYYSNLETCKMQSLKRCMGNFNAKISLNRQTKEQLNWWIHNVVGQSKPMHIENRESDINKYNRCLQQRLGCSFTDQNASVIWTEEEAQFHSNVLELLAILYGLQSLCKDLSNTHILIRTDNMSALAHVITWVVCDLKLAIKLPNKFGNGL